jgi:hypothetical protein
MTDKAYYRKYNDRTHNSSTYHKKDGTPIKAILKWEAREEIEEFFNHKSANEVADGLKSNKAYDND